MHSIIRQGIVLNALMLAALVSVLCGLVSRFVPELQPAYFVGACFLVVLVIGFMHTTLQTTNMWTNEVVRYLAPEFFILLVVMRIAVTLSFVVVPLQTLLTQWFYNPLTIFDVPFVVALIIGCMISWNTHTTMQHLRDLAPQSVDLPSKEPDSNQYYQYILSEDRAYALRRINQRFVGGGVLLLLSLGIEAVNIERIASPSLPLSTLSVVGALVYIVSGLLLYSQTRLVMLYARWQAEGAQVAAVVSRRWRRVSWLVIAGVVGVAALLPRSYGLGLLDALRTGLGFVGYIITILAYVVIWLLTLIAFIPAWLLSLFASTGTGTPPPAAPPFVLPEEPPPAVYEPQIWATLLFWVCMLMLVGYALSILLRRYPGIGQAIARFVPVGVVWRWIRSIWGDARVWAQQAVEVVQTRLQSKPKPVVSRSIRLRLNKLLPRDLVRYFYFSTLRRASERGLPRRSSQTPHEYGTALGRSMPEAQQDIDELTEAFLVAQYSSRALDDEAAQRARGPWQRVRHHLRTLFK